MALSARVNIIANHLSILIDPIQRSQGCPWKGSIKAEDSVRRDEVQPMRDACYVGISTHPPIQTIISKQIRSGRTRHVDWKRQVASAVAGEPVVDPIGVDIVTHDLVCVGYLISKGRGCAWHCERADLLVDTRESWLGTVRETTSTNKATVIVNS